MKKNTKIGLTFTILSILVIAIGVIFAVLAHNERTLQEDMEIIKTAYTSFSGDVVDNYQIRTTVVEKIEAFNAETYPEEHEGFVEYLTAYNEKITSLNTNVAILEDKCSVKYEDTQTDIFCSYYQQLYEAVNNLYVKHLNLYNEKIEEYNENSEEDYELFPLVNKEVIDFDKNGRYEGEEQ